MSDSQFEDLTFSIHSSHLLQQLKEKNHTISELSAKVNAMSQTIVTMKKVQSYLEGEMLKKDDLIKKITGDSIRISQKIIQKEEQSSKLREQVIETEKCYHLMLQQTLIHKSQLIEINSELSNKVLTSEEMVKSMLMEMNKSQQIRREMSQSLNQGKRRMEELEKKIDQLERENIKVKLSLAIKDKQIGQILIEKEREIKQALVRREEQARQDRQALENQRKQVQLKLLSLMDKLSTLQKKNTHMIEHNKLVENNKRFINRQLEESLISSSQQKLTVKRLQEEKCHYIQQNQKQLHYIQQLLKNQQELKNINNDMRSDNKLLVEELQLKLEKTNRRNNQLKSQLQQKESELLSLNMILQKFIVEEQQLRLKLKQHEIKIDNNKSSQQQAIQLRRKTQRLQQQLKQYEQIIHVIEQDSEQYRKQLKSLEKINHQLINKCTHLQNSLKNKEKQLQNLLKDYENSLQLSQQPMPKRQHKPHCSEQFVLIKIKELVTEIQENIAICNFQPKDRILIENQQKQKLLNSIQSILSPKSNHNYQSDKPQPKTTKNQPTNPKNIIKINKYFKSLNPFE